MIVVINGVLVKDSVEPFFIQSSQKRPFSLEGIGKEKWKRLLVKSILGKVALMKNYHVKYWYQSQTHISNLNIFRKS